VGAFAGSRGDAIFCACMFDVKQKSKNIRINLNNLKKRIILFLFIFKNYIIYKVFFNFQSKKIKIMENDGQIVEKDEPVSMFNGARAAAIRILSRFERSDSYIDKLVDYELRTGNLSDLDKSLLTELVNGVIRWKSKIDWVLVGFYHGDYLKCLNIVKNAMRVALYQILYLDRIPIPAAINDSVEIIKRIQGEKTAGIVNGVLRNIARSLDNVRFPEKDEDPIYYYSVIYSHPRWMVKRWMDRFGEMETEKLLYINNRRPYICIRVNTLKTKPEDVMSWLKANEIIYLPSPLLKQSILLKGLRGDISALEIFKNGWITVQDTSASLVTLLSKPKPGYTILDLCAAPGGKSFLLAELIADRGRIIAVDQYRSKLRFIEEGADRLGITSITALCEDAESMKFDEQVDLVCVDVPCSGTGTISKKPDIKWKRERDDIVKLVDSQRKILVSASKLIKSGGAIIYTTCSIEPEENQENIEWFLKNNPDFELESAEKYLPKEICKDGYVQIFPHIHNIDGAFGARLIKKDSKPE